MLPNVDAKLGDQLIKDTLDIPTSLYDVPLDTSGEHQIGITLNKNLETRF